MSEKEEPKKRVEKPDIEKINRSIFDAYQQDSKSDSLAPYVYLKYIRELCFSGNSMSSKYSLDMHSIYQTLVSVHQARAEIYTVGRSSS
jgi:hypothetical protein